VVPSERSFPSFGKTKQELGHSIIQSPYLPERGFLSRGMTAGQKGRSSPVVESRGGKAASHKVRALGAEKRPDKGAATRSRKGKAPIGAGYKSRVPCRGKRR